MAVFMVLVFVFPFDAANLPARLPFDLTLDRIALVGIAVIWFASLATGSPRGPRFARAPLNVALPLFVAVAVTGVALNLQRIAILDEFDLALKKLFLLAVVVVFYFVVASVVRPGEVRAFSKLLLGLGVITAIGTIWEFRTGDNSFFNLAAKIPGLEIEPRESSAYFDATGRRNITGPTDHGLAATTMLALVLPFAVVGLLRAREFRGKLIYAAVTCIVLTGSLATVRKTAAIVPLVALAVLFFYRPKPMIRLLPLGLAMVIVIHLIVPGAMGGIRSQLFPENSGFFSQPSVEGRSEDYAAVAPDLVNHIAFGRGYGTYDPEPYRLLDNQYLGIRIEMGWLGLAAYLLILLAILVPAHKLILAGDPRRAPPALAAASAAAVLGVASFLFDSLAFPQVQYVFLFIGALLTATAAGAYPVKAVKAKSVQPVWAPPPRIVREPGGM